MPDRSEGSTDPVLAVEGWTGASWSPRLELWAIPGKTVGCVWRGKKKKEVSEKGILTTGDNTRRGEEIWSNMVCTVTQAAWCCLTVEFKNGERLLGMNTGA